MNRHLRQLGLLIALGAIVNVLVTLALAAMKPGPFWMHRIHKFRSSAAVPHWHLDQRLGHTFQRLVWRHMIVDFSGSPGRTGDRAVPTFPLEANPPPWSLIDWTVPPPADRNLMFVVVVEDARGWPLLSQSSISRITFSAQPTLSSQWGVALDGYRTLDEWKVRVLPFRPIWHGFAMNTLFYGSITFLALNGYLALRRAHRVRRRLCAECAYPVGLSPVCSECGGQV
ncbi:MAG: hypothetical protein L0Z53_20280, partial [Acidobacteriales bacterium]|nr:hypothetical protein [Terriglobales bacterium]